MPTELLTTEDLIIPSSTTMPTKILSTDHIATAEKMSQQLEEWGLLGAYSHLLNQIAARRVAIPPTHLYEFAAREFERYGSRRKGGMINLQHEKRIAGYRQKQISRRIHDTARELRFDKALREVELENKTKNEPVEDFLMLGVDLSQDTETPQETPQVTPQETPPPEQEILKDFLMQGADDQRPEDVQANRQRPASESNKRKTIKQMTSKSSMDFVGNVFEQCGVPSPHSNRCQETPTPEKLGLSIPIETAPSTTTENLGDLQVFAPMLLNLVFKSFDQQNDRQNPAKKVQPQPEVLSRQPEEEVPQASEEPFQQELAEQMLEDQALSQTQPPKQPEQPEQQEQLPMVVVGNIDAFEESDLSDGSDLSLLSESIQEEPVLDIGNDEITPTVVE